MPGLDFSFAEHAVDFETHISSSIPGYRALLEKCVGLSRRFVQNESAVVDIGCTTGSVLRSLREANHASRSGADYIGIDIEPKFKQHWRKQRARNLRFEIGDIRSYPLANVSYACSLFTLQFLRFPDKLPVLGHIYSSLCGGGALMIAEKVLASSARLQDALTFPYYDYKLRSFTEREILEKERSLRGQMTLWTEVELKSALQQVGFRELEVVWSNFPFVSILALK